ncbi:MAG: hypothetical protein ACLUEQ_09725 [Cloacibacillus evryensis]
MLAERRRNSSHVQEVHSPFLNRYRAFATWGVEGGVLKSSKNDPQNSRGLPLSGRPRFLHGRRRYHERGIDDG